MLKTENYNLNKPEPNDPLRLEDFNENSDLIDAALKSVQNEAAAGIEQVEAKLSETILVGHYVGNATDNELSDRQTIDLGFQPRLLIVRDTAYKGSTSSNESWTVRNLGIATPGNPHRTYGNYVVLEIMETGFICGGVNEGFNMNSRTYAYLAIR